MELIKLKINVSKILKEHLFRGEKGVYLDAVLIPTPNSQYQDAMIKQDLGKEARERGEDGPIIGGGTVIQRRQETRGTGQPQQQETPQDGGDDDVPF